MNNKVDKTTKKYIKNKVLQTLQRIENITLPTSIIAIVRAFSNCRLIPYSVHMKKYNLTYKQVIEFTESPDACTDYDAVTDRYIIYYNDIDTNIMQSNRYRWNIAHELGHIVLNHHKKYERTKIFRSTLSDSEYNMLEKEADYFAAYILVPHSVLYIKRVMRTGELQNLCQISKKASIFRFKEYLSWIFNNPFKDTYDINIAQLFINKIKCSNCETVFVKNNIQYCPVCGNNKFYFYGGINNNMIYDSLNVDDKGKLSICPICENEQMGSGNYCPICGTYIVNECTNCFEMQSGYARYCHSCGNETTFLQNGLLQDWTYAKSNIENDANNKMNNGTDDIIQSQFKPVELNNDDDLPF